LLVRDGSNANIYVGPTATVGAGWVEFSDTFTFTSSNPTNCDVMFKVNTGTGMLDGDVYYFDDISVVPSNVSLNSTHPAPTVAIGPTYTFALLPSLTSNLKSLSPVSE